MASDNDAAFAETMAKSAWDDLALARDIRRRVIRGEACAWEARRVDLLATSARAHMRLSLALRGIRPETGRSRG
ncbi:hypothetical protein NK718_16790 [Alsobacter sp. SYSU M60028]|uniref:Uncharacterized protein n=1 Tax=Alsobacter ponti TaxID=2962936 RepID=A0ABT1LFC2_9HYPH|nr:hypothetical protein [Alsobacter ponti]MCP8940186.1 hypothetical protein [Alsobacter ponti]